MDLDDNMTTSTSSSSTDPISGDQDPNYDEDEDDNLFPDATSSPTNAVRPHTPSNDHLNASAPGELSPPRSHTQQIQSQSYDKMEAQNGKNMSQTSNPTTVTKDGKQAATESVEDKPGYAWKNKKAQEEMHRAWDNIVDRDFSLKEYGDVMMQGKPMEQGKPTGR